jgi:hypothetical protein
MTLSSNSKPSKTPLIKLIILASVTIIFIVAFIVQYQAHIKHQDYLKRQVALSIINTISAIEDIPPYRYYDEELVQCIKSHVEPFKDTKHNLEIGYRCIKEINARTNK